MQIRVELMGSLKERMPAGGMLALPESATVEQALAALGIDAAHVQIVMLNGRPQSDRRCPLSSGDTLTILPLVGGG